MDRSTQRALVRERVMLAELEPALWTGDLLGFRVEFAIPPVPVTQLTYFIRWESSGVLTPPEFFTHVQYGTPQGAHIISRCYA